MIEYLIGSSRPTNYTLTPNSLTNSTVLFSEIYSKIIFHMLIEENTNNLGAIEINNEIIIGTKYDGSKSIEIELFNESNYFDSMEFQQVIKQAGDKPNLFWTNITYLQIVYQGKTYTIGQKKNSGLVILPDKQNVNLKYDFQPVEVVSNPFYISGLHVHNAGICGLQIIEFNEGEHTNFENLLHLFSFGQGIIGLIEGQGEADDEDDKDDDEDEKDKNNKENKKDESDNNENKQDESNNKENEKDNKKIKKFNLELMVMDHNLVSIENLEPIKLLELIYKRLRKWTDGRSVTSTYYPKFLSIIDEAIVEREYNVIHSVLRLERYLKSIIQRNIQLDSQKKYQEDLGLTVKLYQVWKPLANSMELCQKIHNGVLELNCYEVAYLSNDKVDMLYAMVTIVCQISLIILLGLSLMSIDAFELFPLYEGIVIIPIITIFTVFVVSKQFTNTLNFIKVFPDSINTWVGRFDIFSNVVCALVVVLLNFFILAFSNSLMDIVLNSLAALFIIELDDSMVFISSNIKDDLIKQKVIAHLNLELKNIDEIYFESKTWNKNKIFRLNEDNYYVDRKLCEIHKKSDKKNVDDVNTIDLHEV